MLEIDNIDRDIVKILTEDGRMNAAQIARRLDNVTERVVRYRLDRMIEAGVIRVSAIVNPKALGLSVTADVFLEVESGHIEQVAEQLTGFENVSYVAFSIGQNDVSLQVVGRDNAEIHDFITRVLGRIQYIKRTQTSLVPFTLKDVYQWQIPASCVRKR